MLFCSYDERVSRLETNGYYALGVPLYVALGALELALAKRKGVKAYRLADTIGNVSAGLGEVIIGLFLGPYLLALYDYGFATIRLVRWPAGSWVPWALAFLLGDLCYYWYHRAGHAVGALWAIHGVHHQTEEFNMSIALRHPWLSDLYSAVFYIPLPLLGVPPEHFFIAITIISFYALTIHSHLLQRPSLFIFVTPATHVVHHAKNPRYINKNFGAMFSIWDRMFGTHVEVDPADPPRLGTLSGYETHDGARSQWIFFRNLIATARHGESAWERVKTFLMPPGYRPPGAPIHRGGSARARDDDEIPFQTRVYASIQMLLVLALAIYVLWLRDRHPGWMLMISSALVLVSLSTIGGLLDGRRTCDRDERARLAIAFAFGAVIAIASSYVAMGVAIACVALGSALLLPRQPPKLAL